MMSASSNKVEKDEKVDKALKPEWLQSFLREPFFEKCTVHPVKNGLNNYCITCDQSVGQHCASLPTHRQHKTLKIYRHCFKNVVPLDAMANHIDCSEIQRYRNNKNWVIALEPLPHSRSVKWGEETLCDICKRKLADPKLYRFCSISCKVQAVLNKPDESVPPFISLEKDRKDQTAGASEDETAGASLRKRKREGTPIRSPLF